ncbi:hypothetical protein [Nonomuraea roseola]|uniref:Uncharacterized protein n=1 Tax=Nonomuraea roseola TaxID=46179 RepID=A0ABV5Q4N8_9ACTN
MPRTATPWGIVAFGTPLDGGGTRAVLEFLSPLDEAWASEVARQWREGVGDAALDEVRHAAAAVDAEYRARLPGGTAST